MQIKDKIKAMQKMLAELDDYVAPGDATVKLGTAYYVLRDAVALTRFELSESEDKESA